jgi:hypothetical protein
LMMHSAIWRTLRRADCGQGRAGRRLLPALKRALVSGISRSARLAVDVVGESAYARGSFDMFEESSAGIALARADRAFCRLHSCLGTNAWAADTRMNER